MAPSSILCRPVNTAPCFIVQRLTEYFWSVLCSHSFEWVIQNYRPFLSSHSICLYLIQYLCGFLNNFKVENITKGKEH